MTKGEGKILEYICFTDAGGNVASQSPFLVRSPPLSGGGACTCG